MRKLDCEIVVVGGGPAGSALAIRLARAGRDVLVVDSAEFPRDKPCGDCVNPGAVAELERLGLADRLRATLAPVPLRGWRVEAPDGTAFSAGFGLRNGGEWRGWAIRRREFDAALMGEARRAGAKIGFGLRVFDVLREGGRVVGVTAREGTAIREIRGRFVVGADGLRSVIRQRLGLGRRAPRLRKIALVGHQRGLVSDGTATFGELRLRGGRCCGYAPLPGGANVTIVIPEQDAGAISGGSRAFFWNALSSFPEVKARVQGSGLEERIMVTGPFDYPVRRPWAPGALLVGDASGYYDPFTGQGIRQALRTGSLAAETLLSIVAGAVDERRAFARYGRRVTRELARGRAVQHLIESVVSRPRLMSRFVRALSGRSTAVRLLRVTGDLDDPLRLADPIMWARLVYRLGDPRT
jgi:flavin-dependent dehydrogenase